MEKVASACASSLLVKRGTHCQLRPPIGRQLQLDSPSLGSDAGGANRRGAHRGHAGRDAGRYRVTGYSGVSGQTVKAQGLLRMTGFGGRPTGIKANKTLRVRNTLMSSPTDTSSVERG